jgi:FixJ family two-component response regulator
MPEINGIQMQDTLRQRGWPVPVIFISGESTLEQSIAAMKQGALDFLIKPFDLDKLLEVIENAVKIDAKQTLQASRQQDLRRRLDVLKPRELQAYMCLTKGYSYSEMMRALEISLPTAKQYRAAVMRKLKFSTLAELLEFDRELRTADVGASDLSNLT